MSAGGGTDKWRQALELEAMMVKTFGPDFREKAVPTMFGAWPLRDCFAECGLEDPRAEPSSGGYGLWQITPWKTSSSS